MSGEATGRFTIRIEDEAVLAYLKTLGRRLKGVLKKGVRAALKVIRTKAADLAPTGDRPGDFMRKLKQQARGYRTKVDVSQDLRIRGTLSAISPGNIIQVGRKAGVTPMTPELEGWLIRHGRRDLVERLRKRDGALVKVKAIKLRGYPARPFVIPAAEAAEAAATEAFEAAVMPVLED